MTVDSSIPYNDLETYFRSNKYVTLTKNSDRILGSIRVPSTTISVKGDNAEKIIEDYRMAFLTAGG